MKEFKGYKFCQIRFCLNKGKKHEMEVRQSAENQYSMQPKLKEIRICDMHISEIVAGRLGGHIYHINEYQTGHTFFPPIYSLHIHNQSEDWGPPP